MQLHPNTFYWLNLYVQEMSCQCDTSEKVLFFNYCIILCTILKIYLQSRKIFQLFLRTETFLHPSRTHTFTVFILFQGNKDASRVSISTFIINSYRQTCLWSEIHGWREICLLYGTNRQRDVVLFFWFPRRCGDEARRLKVHWGPLPVIIIQD